MNANCKLVVDPPSIPDDPRRVEHEDLRRPFRFEPVGQFVADVFEAWKGNAVAVGVSPDRDGAILLIGVDSEECDPTLGEVAADCGQPGSIRLGQGALGPNKGEDHDLAGADLIQCMPGSAMILEPEVDRRQRSRLAQFGRKQQQDDSGHDHGRGLVVQR